MNRALVVADLAAGREVIGKELVEAGFGLLFTESVAEVLFLLEAEQPHVIVTDHDKPRVDGLELVRRVRAVSDVPVVVLTAFGSIPDCEQAMRLGADRFLQYRRDLDRLGQVARELVDPGHARRLMSTAPSTASTITPTTAPTPALTTEDARALRERELRERLQTLVIECRGNIAEVARRMERDRSTIRYHLRRLGLLG